MGLSSSQARLLTLTSRQHTVEGEAQRIQANKLRLANDSDQAYMKYINALDDTALQTKQISKQTGASSWIGGSLNNLLRYQASDDYTGSVFYVQDLSSGQLYMPQAICDNYAAAAPSGDDTIIMDFVKKCDSSITYEKIDRNAEIKQQYEIAVAQGFNTAATDAILKAYYDALAKDNAIIEPAQQLLSSMPNVDSNGLYTKSNDTSMTVTYFKEAVKRIVNSSNYNSVYSAEERAIIESSVAMVTAMGDAIPKDSDNTYDTGTDVERNVKIVVSPKAISSVTGGVNYMEFYTYDPYQNFVTMLNGGTLKWYGNIATEVNWKNEGYVALDQVPADALPYGTIVGPFNLFDKKNTKKNADEVKEWNVYNDFTVTSGGTTKTGREILDAYSGTNGTYGSALTNILTSKISGAKNGQSYLLSVGKTEADIRNYQEFLNAKVLYDAVCVGGVYQPDYEFVASDKVKAAYYEQIYNAIKSAGGCKPVTEERAKNENWVQNMIKSTQVMLTAWDEEHEMLSRTLSSLNTNIQEVSDQNYIEDVSQEYEATLDLINAKDSRYDQRLQTLESEREAISTEIDSLKKVMKENIDANFKVFS